jgi:hypothetical protein
MIGLPRAALDGVVGGGSGAPNVSDVRTRNGPSVHTERTDFAYCQDVVQRNCQAANTSWLLGTDQKAAAQCTLDNLPRACPPSLSGGPSQ